MGYFAVFIKSLTHVPEDDLVGLLLYTCVNLFINLDFRFLAGDVLDLDGGFGAFSFPRVTPVNNEFLTPFFGRQLLV